MNVSCIWAFKESNVKSMIVLEYEDVEAFARFEKFWVECGSIAKDFFSKIEFNIRKNFQLVMLLSFNLYLLINHQKVQL